jgi:hypothetical protein
MIQLKHSSVYRYGLTAHRPVAETDHISARVNQYARRIDLSFKLASKGDMPILFGTRFAPWSAC